MLFPFLIYLFYLCLLLEANTTFPKFEKASLTAWSLTYPGWTNVTKIGSFPFLGGPDRRFWKLRIISLSRKRLWISVTCNFSYVIFDSKIIMNCEILSFQNKKKYTILGVLLSRLSVEREISSLLEQRVPPLEVFYHIILARKLFEPARGSSKLSSRAKLQPSSEGGQTYVSLYQPLLVVNSHIFLECLY